MIHIEIYTTNLGYAAAYVLNFLLLLLNWPDEQEDKVLRLTLPGGGEEDLVKLI